MLNFAEKKGSIREQGRIEEELDSGSVGMRGEFAEITAVADFRTAVE